jgi:hypothetical protein
MPWRKHVRTSTQQKYMLIAGYARKFLTIFGQDTPTIINKCDNYNKPKVHSTFAFPHILFNQQSRCFFHLCLHSDYFANAATQCLCNIFSFFTLFNKKTCWHISLLKHVFTLPYLFVFSLTCVDNFHHYYYFFI